MQVTFSARNNQIIHTLPIVPPDIEITSESKDEKFDTAQYGTILLVGDPGLRELTIESFFPSRPYEFMAPGSRADPKQYISFFEAFRKLKEPIRIVMTLKDGSTFLNMPVRVGAFSYSVMQNGDIGYSLPLVEYPFVYL